MSADALIGGGGVAGVCVENFVEKLKNKFTHTENRRLLDLVDYLFLIYLIFFSSIGGFRLDLDEIDVY